MMFGLKGSDLDYIVETIKGFHEIEKAVIFGSRVKGNYKPGSDVDIGIYGEKVTLDTVASLKYRLEEEGPLPYFFDIVDCTHLKHEELKDHIDRVGIVLFVKRQSLDQGE